MRKNVNLKHTKSAAYCSWSGALKQGDGLYSARNELMPMKGQSIMANFRMVETSFRV